MICPTCKSDMIVVEHDNVELDYCTDCSGVWFDAGEMNLLFQNIDIDGGGRGLWDLDDVQARFPAVTGALETEHDLFLTSLFGHRVARVDKQDLNRSVQTQHLNTLRKCDVHRNIRI